MSIKCVATQSIIGLVLLVLRQFINNNVVSTLGRVIQPAMCMKCVRRITSFFPETKHFNLTPYLMLIEFCDFANLNYAPSDHYTTIAAA